MPNQEMAVKMECPKQDVVLHPEIELEVEVFDLMSVQGLFVTHDSVKQFAQILSDIAAEGKQVSIQYKNNQVGVLLPKDESEQLVVDAVSEYLVAHPEKIVAVLKALD